MLPQPSPGGSGSFLHYSVSLASTRESGQDWMHTVSVSVLGGRIYVLSIKS